jgi:polyhydroxyalkanoate synthase
MSTLPEPQAPRPGASDAVSLPCVSDLAAMLAGNPMLASLDAMWNANPMRAVIPVDWAAIAHALRVVWLRSLARPDRMFSIGTGFGANALRATVAAWGEAVRSYWGTAADAGPPARGDKRFAGAEWQTYAGFGLLKDLYLLASDALLDSAAEDDLDPEERQRVNFHLMQFINAMSPSLMLLSNPVALRRAMQTGGASLVSGMNNLLGDLRDGRLSIVDTTAFAPGRNLAMTPGKVVHRNRLIELIQYAPSTATVHARPILIMPPWINKFYILDMQPKNSMVRYLVAQGFTVFVVSWKNPDASMEETSIADYMHLGPLAAADVIRDIVGTDAINVLGYCIAGTLLAMTLAWLAGQGDTRFNAATFMVSLQDFARVGDTAVFADEPSVALIEQQMLERGYLDSRELANMFNLLRPNDLIWANVVNNYLLGEKPPAFDLLYWNSDGTRMARAAHSWYLRNTYRENNLIRPDAIELGGLGRSGVVAWCSRHPAMVAPMSIRRWRMEQ